MDRPFSARAREIFDEAFEKPAAERMRFLDAACGADAPLRERVEALLAVADGAGDFLAAPTVAGAGEAPEAGPGAGADTDSSTLPAPSCPPGLGTLLPWEGAGSRVGRYRLVKAIGEGGFGTVFMAEQEHPVRRQVALKVIKLGMDTREVIARFERERQALALMDHPNIARVFDAGATDTGRPFFVMELVEGVPVTDYCDRNHLTTRHRLELFVQVCRAVQHAHQKSVIHLDIKPSNVLVATVDGKAVPKVIDFGIAKATDHRLAEHTLFTDQGQMVGTPAYMSPEQTVLSGRDVDTRSDIYSLGVLLYELLTGTTPFDAADLRSKAFGEIQRIIREVEPPKPSTRLSMLGDVLAAIAARRGTEPRRLGGVLKKELDWVVMKCLEKNRSRRYDSAGALATDVTRHLRDEPVQARPPSRAYKLRKFARRNKGLIAAAAAVALAFLLGGVAAAVGFVRASRERDVVNREREKAQQLAAFFQEYASMVDPRAVDMSLLAMLHMTRELDSSGVRAHPDVEGAVRAQLGKTYAAVGMHDQADAELRAALALRAAVSGEGHLDVAEILSDLANLHRQKGDEVEASVHYRRSEDILRRQDAAAAEGMRPETLGQAIALAKQTAAVNRSPHVPRLRAARGTLYARRGDFAKAAADYDAAIAAHPGNHWWWFYRAFLRLQLGQQQGYRDDCRQMLDRFGGSRDPWEAERVAKANFLVAGDEESHSRSMRLIDRALKLDVPPSGRPWLLMAKGMGEYRAGHFPEAVDYLDRSKAGMDQPSVLATVEFFLAVSHQGKGDPREAAAALARGLALMETAVPKADSGDLSGGNRNWGVENWIAAQVARREALEKVQPGEPATTRAAGRATRPTATAPQ